jgi:hypothetical protein
MSIFYVNSGSIDDLTVANFSGTGSLHGTASAALTASFISGSVGTAISASYATTTSYYAETDPIFISKSGSYATTGSNLFIGTQELSGSLQLNPTQDPGSSNTTSSFLFVTSSADNTEYNLHYRNNGALWETHWLEERVDTGIVWGGVTTFSGSTIYITPGAGLIINHNANTGSHGDTVPTYVQFGPITASATFITSSQVTYLLIDETGNLLQQTTVFTPQQFNEKLPIGYIFCLTTSSISSFADARTTTYGQDEQQTQFIRSFGPLKVYGYDITPQSGSLKISIASGRTYRIGGFYTQSPDTPSIYDSTTVATGSLVRVYRDPAAIGGFRATLSSSGFPFSDIDPTKWDDGSGTLQTVGSGEWTIQRLFQGVVNNITYIYYGQNTYDSLNAAIQSITTEAFEESETSIIALPFIGYVIARGNTTDLGDTTNNKIINSGLFRNTAGSSGGGGVATTKLNDLSDVIITSPTNGQALIYNAGEWINGSPTNAVSASYANTASYVAATGNNNEIQYNSNGSFAATASFAFIHASESLQHGNSTVASGILSHAQGDNTIAYGYGSHAEGSSTIALGDSSHAEGAGTKTGDNNGYLASITNGTASLSASYGDVSNVYLAGNLLYVNDVDYDQFLGIDTILINSSSFDGTSTQIFLDDNSLTTTTAVVLNLSDPSTWNGDQRFGAPKSHAEGSAAIALGLYSHAEGTSARAIGNTSHAEGRASYAIGVGSHAEGFNTQTTGLYSHAEGYGTVAAGFAQHASGHYNKSNTSSLVIIGNGTDNSNRSDLALFNTDGIVFNQPVTASIVSASFEGNLTGTASFATSASWAPSGITIDNNVNDYIFTATGINKLNGESNLQFDGTTLKVTGNVTANSFTGSLQGTAATASFVTSSDIFGPYGANSVTSASFAVSASWAPGSTGVTINNNTNNNLVTATGTANTLDGEPNLTFNGSTLAVTGNVTANSFTGSLQGTATTASFVQTAQTASYVLNAVSASFAVSASWAPGGGGGTTFAAGNVDNRLITATGTTPELNGEANLTFNGSVLRITGSLDVSESLNTSLRQLYNGGLVSVDWNSYQLFDAAGVSTITWNDRKASDTSGNVSIDWDARQLVSSSGAVTANWNTQETYDSASVASIQWNARRLLGPTGQTVLNWNNGTLFGTASFATTASFITASNVYGPAGADSVTTASFATTSSFANNSPVQSSTSGVGNTPTATQTDTVTHSLGRIPAKIRIYGMGGFTNNASATPTPFSLGTWTSSGNRCIYQPIGATLTSAATPVSSTTFSIRIDTAAGANIQGVIQNVTSTSFDIAWTETGAVAARVYLWEAE